MPRNTIVKTFSITPEFLELMDSRAKALGMSRTQYLTQLIRRDLDDAAAGAEFRIAEGTKPATPFPAPQAVNYAPKKRAAGQK